MEQALNDHTRAVIINSPNNPTGQVYDEDLLRALGDVLAKGGARFGRPIYLINDEPYRRLMYDGLSLPSIFQAYPDSLVATSFSKDLSLAGERIGYLALNPRAQARSEIMAGLIIANRILGYINAPALMQRVVAKLTETSVDIAPYARRRELFSRILEEIGYDFVKPQGTFYLFPRSPIADDVAFIQELKQENILAVPGRGFGCPGYFRLAFCVPESTYRRGCSRLWPGLCPGGRQGSAAMSKRLHLKEPAPIREVLNKILKPADLRQLEFQARVRQVWEQNVSHLLRQHTELVDFNKKTLYVEVAANPWMQELHFLKPRILAAMQRQLGEQVIKDIKFRLK